LTDEGDSWTAHRATLNPTFARRHLNELVDLMIEPIESVTSAIEEQTPFDMHETMVKATLRVVANALFSQDFGPLVASMNDLATRGLRRTEKFGRLGLWGLMPRPVYDALMWCTFFRCPVPPPFREAQHITLALDAPSTACSTTASRIRRIPPTCSTCCSTPTTGHGRVGAFATRR